MSKKKPAIISPPPALSDDQDSAWKEMLDEYLAAFLRFFFPAVYEEIDWTRGYESLDKELAENRPAGSAGKLLADKLFKVWLKSGKPAWLLIHIEVQGRAGPVFNKRVFFYNFRLRDDQKVEVISLAVLTGARPGRAGHYKTERCGCSHDFHFPAVRIIDFADRWDELDASDEIFALVAKAQLMALETKGDNERRYIWKRRLVFSLYERGLSREEIANLFRFMDWAMKMPAELENRLKRDVYEAKEKKMPYLSTIERMAMWEELLSAVTLLLTHRFGELSGRLQTKLKELTREQMRELLVAQLDFKTKTDLHNWLKQYAGQNGSPRKQNGTHTKKESR